MSQTYTQLGYFQTSRISRTLQLRVHSTLLRHSIVTEKMNDFKINNKLIFHSGCCIYEKPHKFGESDSDDSDDECEHCFGHVEHRKQKQALQQDGGGTTTTTQVIIIILDQVTGHVT